MNAHERKAQADSNDNKISKGIFRNLGDFSGGSNQSLVITTWQRKLLWVTVVLAFKNTIFVFFIFWFQGFQETRLPWSWVKISPIISEGQFKFFFWNWLLYHSFSVQFFYPNLFHWDAFFLGGFFVCFFVKPLNTDLWKIQVKVV